MRIAVDLDGVCYEFDRTCRYMLREYRGLAYLTKPARYWDDVKDQVPKDDWKWLWTEGVERGLFRYGHMTTGARKALEALVEDGHTITVVTHRPANAREDTEAWVDLFFKNIPLDDFVMLHNGESKRSVPARILIDDKMANVMEWSGADTRNSILFDRPWNQGPGSCLRGCTAPTGGHIGHIYRGYGWEDTVDCIRGL